MPKTEDDEQTNQSYLSNTDISTIQNSIAKKNEFPLELVTHLRNGSKARALVQNGDISVFSMDESKKEETKKFQFTLFSDCLLVHYAKSEVQKVLFCCTFETTSDLQVCELDEYFTLSFRFSICKQSFKPMLIKVSCNTAFLEVLLLTWKKHLVFRQLGNKVTDSLSYTLWYQVYDHAILSKPPKSQTFVYLLEHEKLKNVVLEGNPLTLMEIDEAGATLLHYIAFLGYKTLFVDILLKHEDLLLSSFDNSLLTPLHYAAVSLKSKTFEILFERVKSDLEFSDCFVTDMQNRTPVFVAVESYFCQPNSLDPLLNIINVITDFPSHLLEIRNADGISLADLCLLNYTVENVLTVSESLFIAGFTPSFSTVTKVNFVKGKEAHFLRLVRCFLDWGGNGNEILSIIQQLEALIKWEPVHKRALLTLLGSFGCRPGIYRHKVKDSASLEAGFQKFRQRQAPQEQVEKLQKISPELLPVLKTDSDGKRHPEKCECCLHEKLSHPVQGFNLLLTKNVYSKKCHYCFRFCCVKCAKKKMIFYDNQVAVQKRVCVLCFNRLSMIVRHRAGQLKELSPVKNIRSNPEKQVKENKKKLFDKKLEQVKEGNVREKKASRAAANIQSSLQSLVQRAEKLASMDKKTTGVSKEAENFASLAEKIRKKQEKQAGWFGLF
eukprot:maker-scaffold_5-snap-gene-3.45-mRNA-1 protein AED:0.07 eAED:0.96 QI:0/0/0/1/1/1/2/0/664